MSKKKSKEQFIEEATAINGDEYEYSLVEYISTHINVDIICRTHGIFQQTPASHLGGRGCPHCSGNKAKRTNLKKYGTEHPTQNEKVKEKRKNTFLEKYGVESPAQNTDVQAKIKATNLEKYGVEYTFQASEVKSKIKIKNIEKYGVENPAQNTDVQAKIKATNLEKYGVEYTQQNKDIQDKRQATNLKKYNTKFPKQHHMVDILPLIQNKNWLSDQYIDKSAMQIADELGINGKTIGRYLKNHDIPINYTVGYSKIAIQWLDQIMEQDRIFIRHAGNIGEYTIPNTRYKVDGYCKETNTIYEFHGDIFHGNPDVFGDDDTPNYHDRSITAKELYDNTIKREELIKSLGYNLVVLWENDYK